MYSINIFFYQSALPLLQAGYAPAHYTTACRLDKVFDLR